MKKLVSLCIVMVVLAVPCFAGLGDVASVSVASTLQGDGFTAVYDGSKITWSGGASITFYDGTEAPILTLADNINLSATFEDVTDDSSGSVASATFDVINWSVSYNSLVLLSGGNVAGEVYTEEEQSLPYPPFDGSGTLAGAGIVQVTGGLLTGTWAHGGGDFGWADSVFDAAKLKSEIIVGPSFDSYATQTYETFNTTMWIYADETIVPEPMTVILLGLGALSLRKRR
jgi:hypothetical protein